MNYKVNGSVNAVSPPPIADAAGWVVPGATPEPFINLSQAVPSYAPAAALQARVAAAAADPAASLYTEIRGLPALRAALAADMARDYGGRIEAADVAITAGCNQAFCAALSALAGPGDNVVLTAPWYFNHQMWLDMQGVEVRPLPAVTGNGAVPDAQAAEALIDDRTRAVVLITPNNPTGATYPAATLDGFFEVAHRRGVALVVDETYKDFRTEPGPAHQLFRRPEWRDTFVQLYSFSKAYALTGYRVGSVIAGPRLLDEIEKVLDCLAICAPHIGQIAALHGLESLAGWKAEKAAMMAGRTAALHAAFAMPGLAYRVVSAGAFFAYVRHPFAGRPARAVAQRLAREFNLLTLPGDMFGPGQDDHLRLAFANVDAELMPEVARRLKASQDG